MKRTTFVIVLAIFVLTMCNIVLLKHFKDSLAKKIDIVHNNLYLAQAEFESYKISTNDILLSLADKMSTMKSDILLMDTEIRADINQTVLMSAEATSSMIDSLIAGFKAIKPSAGSIKGMLE